MKYQLRYTQREGRNIIAYIKRLRLHINIRATANNGRMQYSGLCTEAMEFAYIDDGSRHSKHSKQERIMSQFIVDVIDSYGREGLWMENSAKLFSARYLWQPHTAAPRLEFLDTLIEELEIIFNLKNK